MSESEFRQRRTGGASAERRTNDAPYIAPGGHLLDYLRVLHKRRGTALSVFVAVIAVVALYTYTQVRVYEAQAQLMIEPERPKVVVFKDETGATGDNLDYQETQHRILQSRTLALRTITSLDLSKHPELIGPGTDQVSRAKRLMMSGVSMVVGLVTRFSKATPKSDYLDEKGENENPEIARAVDAFLSRLTITPIRGSQLVDVKFQSTDPELAARAANALAKNYIAQNLEFKASTSKEATDLMIGQLEGQRKKVQSTQAEIQTYREQHQSVSDTERQSLAQQKLAELGVALSRARTDRIQKEMPYQQVASAKADTKTLAELGVIASAPSLQTLRAELAERRRQEAQLRESLGLRHPDLRTARREVETVEGKIEAEVLKIAESIRNDYASARDQERRFNDALEEQRRAMLVNRRGDIEYDRLAREAQSDQEVFQSLLQRTKETAISADLLANNIRLVDAAAVPVTPISPQPYRNLLLGLFGGTLLALGAAFAADYMDKTAKTPEDVRVGLGLPCLGLVPMVADHGKVPLLNNGAPAMFKEAFRSIRTNLLFAANGEPVRTILVTSTSPREGKTVVACNLAMALALTGRKVLLIDADLRRPKVHTIFGHDLEPGLSSIVEPGVFRSEGIIKKCAEGLWLMPAGRVPTNAAEILSSERFKNMLAAVEQHFDWVIIDSAPVLAVTDASVIANLAGAVVFVVGAELTSMPSAQNALEHLEAARAKFAGAVLNRVKFHRNAYFYADHYRREYEEYYVSDQT